MKWLVLLACLSCADTEQYPVADAPDRLTCIIVADMVYQSATRQFPAGETIMVRCVARPPADEPGDALYPQRRKP